MDAQNVRHVGVVGCGLMGAGIVEVAARAGIGVMVIEGSDELAEAGLGRVRASLATAVDRGRLDAEASEEALARITSGTDLTTLAEVDLVIEAATEDPAAKGRIFGRLGDLTRPGTVLASNTSSIPIATLGEASGRPADVVGMHFFNPVPVMALVELTPSAATSDDAFELARAFAVRLGKTTVRSSDEAGFIVNRLLIPYLYDAMRLFERGFATRDDIDAAIRLGLAHPMGPLALADLIGLDTVLSIGEVLRGAFGGERYEAPSVLVRLVGEGKLGRKTGGGFYD